MNTWTDRPGVRKEAPINRSVEKLKKLRDDLRKQASDCREQEKKIRKMIEDNKSG